VKQVLYQIPIDWKWYKFSDVSINITDGAHASPKTIEHALPYVTVRAVDH